MSEDELKQIAKEIRQWAKWMQREADQQHDCCHGDSASDVLEDVSLKLDKIAARLESGSIEALRRTT